MRNLPTRAQVYASERMRELGETPTAADIERVIAETFRDAALVAEQEAFQTNGVRVRGNSHGR